jgi:glutamate-1-semialdehyde aminotransferase
VRGGIVLIAMEAARADTAGTGRRSCLAAPDLTTLGKIIGAALRSLGAYGVKK